MGSITSKETSNKTYTTCKTCNHSYTNLQITEIELTSCCKHARSISVECYCTYRTIHLQVPDPLFCLQGKQSKSAKLAFWFIGTLM